MTAPAAAGRPARRALSVRELVLRLQLVLQENFPQRFWVEGELSNVKLARNGHAWCCLKDGAAQIEGVIWRDDLRALRFSPADGMHVLALVKRIDLYAPSGRLRIQIERMEPQGVGALHRALEQRKARFAAEGLFEEARKQPLPVLPRAVGVATAATGAAVRDVLHVLAARFPDRRVLLRPCRVQGDGAAADIADALDDLNRDGSVEVIIVGRGGGSIEDLWAFNEEAVVRAIARSRIPVVSAVGHETDWTLADLVADVRAPTPSAAAARVMPERRELEGGLVRQLGRLRRALGHRLEVARGRLAAGDAVLADPRRVVRERRLRLDALATRARHALHVLTPARAARLGRAAARLGAEAPRSAARRAELERLGQRLTGAWERRRGEVERALAARAAQIDALSPLAVLGRGFALARRDDGAIVRDAAELRPGDRLDLRFARGGARTEVLETSAEDASAGVGAGPGHGSPRSRAGGAPDRGRDT